jgi:hypothetical protein
VAIPSDPSVTSICTEALKRGGRTTPTTDQINSAIEHQFREVKSDITQRSARHSSLEAQSCLRTAAGQSRYTWPTDADEIRSLQLVTGPLEGAWQGALTAASSGSVTLSASFNQSVADARGKFIYLLNGTGSTQFAQIVDYNNTTKIATLDRSWTTTPIAGTYYMIGLQHYKLHSFDKPWGYDVLQAPYGVATPRRAAPVGREMWLDQPADGIYALWWDYWANLDRLDEAGTVFIRHLREHRSLWIQGVAVKTMQRYDEDRYQSELQVYLNMLDAYAGYSAGIGQVNYTDL